MNWQSGKMPAIASEGRRATAGAGGLLYWAIRALTLASMGLLTRTHIIGRERVPRSGGLLVVANHLSLADPLILVAACPRALTFMTKEELFRPWYARLLADWTGAAFGVRRGQTDVRSVRQALELVRSGAAIVVFPEGTRRPDGLGDAHPGVSYLAARAGCPVLPVGIIGTASITSVGSLWHHPACEVRFGEPFAVVSERGQPSEILDDIMKHIAELLPPQRRGKYLAGGQLASGQ